MLASGFCPAINQTLLLYIQVVLDYRSLFMHNKTILVGKLILLLCTVLKQPLSAAKRMS